MKMLLITSSFPKYGRIGGIFIPDTIRSLNKRGMDVHVLTQNCDSLKTDYELLWPGCEVTYFGWNGRDTPVISLLKNRLFGIFLAAQYFVNGFLAGRRICINWRPDIIFAEWLIPAGLIAYLLSLFTNIPYCCRALGSDVYIAANNTFLRPLIKHITKKSTLLFADGFDLCQKTSALANGKECYFAATARKMENINPSHDLKNDCKRFNLGCIGRLHQVKGQDILVKACNILFKKGIDFRCYLIGEGEERNNIEKLIKNLSLEQNVLLTGRIEDAEVQELLRNMDCVIIPSRSESIPLVLMEAVSAKKALIVSDVGDMGYLAEKYNLGYVVKPEDHNGLAEALIIMSDSKIRASFCNKQQQEELASILSVEAGAKVIFEKIRGLRNNL
jgi:glycosyltransferase involved in cell wall biosynthesis